MTRKNKIKQAIHNLLIKFSQLLVAVLVVLIVYLFYKFVFLKFIFDNPKDDLNNRFDLEILK